MLTADRSRIGSGSPTRRRPGRPIRPRRRDRSLPGQRRRRGRASRCHEGSAEVAGECDRVGPELDRLTRGPTTAAVVPQAAPAPRERLVRDSGVALLALAVVGLAVVMLWPQGGPTGEPTGSVFVVDRAVVTPGPSDDAETPTAAPTGEVAVETDVPVSTPEASAAPHATPKPPAVVTPLPPGRRPGLRAPTRRPTPTPTRDARRRRADADARPDADPDADARPDPDADARPDADADPRADPDADARPDPDAATVTGA